MTNFKDNKSSANSNSDSAHFRGKIKPEDITKEQELKAKEIQDAYYRIYKDLGDLCAEMGRCINNKQDIALIEEELLKKIFRFFKDAVGSVDTKKNCDKVNEAKLDKSKKLKDLLSMIEFFKSLLRKLFTMGSILNWQERLQQEIKDLEKELAEGGLSKEEWLSKLERLNLLKLINFLGPLNFAGMIIKAIAIAIVLEATSIVGEELVKGVEILLERERAILPENVEIKDKVMDNLIVAIVGMLSSGESSVQNMETRFNEVIIANVPNKVKVELGIADPRKIPFSPEVEVTLQLTVQPEKKAVPKKPKEEPQKAAPELIPNDNEILYNERTLCGKPDSMQMTKVKARKKHSNGNALAQLQNEASIENRNASGLPSTNMQDIQLVRLQSDVILNRHSKN